MTQQCERVTAVTAESLSLPPAFFGGSLEELTFCGFQGNYFCIILVHRPSSGY